MPGKSLSWRFSLEIKFARISSLTETLLKSLALSSPKVVARSIVIWFEKILIRKPSKYEFKATRPEGPIVNSHGREAVDHQGSKVRAPKVRHCFSCQSG